MIKLLATEVLPHVEKATIIITGDTEKTVVVVICDPKDDGKKVKPITIKGTAEEVEAALGEAIQAVFTDNKEVLTNYKDVAADVKETKKTEKLPVKKTTKATAAKETAEPEETDEPAEETAKEEVKYSKEQKTAQKKAADALTKAKNSKDPDMVNYLTTQYLKEYEKAKMPEAEIEQLKNDFAAILKEVETQAPATGTDVDDGLFAEPAKPETKVEKPAAKAEKPKAPVKKEVPAPPQNQDEDDTMIF